MNVAFDISELAISTQKPETFRGINRVVQTIFDLMIERDNVTATSTINTFLGAQYLKQFGYHQIPFAHRSPISSALGYLACRASNFNFENLKDTHLDRCFFRKSSRAASAAVNNAIQSVTRKAGHFDLSNINIFHQPAPYSFPEFIRSYKRKNFARFMTIYDFIPLEPRYQNPSEGRYLRKVLESLSPADHIICISDHVKNQACERLGIDPKQIFVAPLAASKFLFFPNPDPDQLRSIRTRINLGEEPYFLTLCALDSRKNMRTLLMSFAELCKQQPGMNANLVLAGSVDRFSRQPLTDFISSLGIQHRIILPGFVPDDCLSTLYSGALAFIFPSLAEGFGLPPLEAMQCGTPVISSNLTSLPEVVGDAGILLDPLDRDAISNAMLKLFSNESLRDNLSKLGVARASLFSWDQCIQKHRDAYQIALAS